ncbi:hypothetical protein [Burkholderia contaminans]|uniref:hypothetical protein n=1 Tax=Burkholderia contaminans TaxID=488447 RepID=UPI003D673E64
MDTVARAHPHAAARLRPDPEPGAWDDRMLEGEWEDALETVFDTGRLLVDTSFAEVRARAHAGEV